jgi:hypothetical protein
LVETATITSSNSPAALAITSQWPLCRGSKEPGYTARRILMNLVQRGIRDVSMTSVKMAV